MSQPNAKKPYSENEGASPPNPPAKGGNPQPAIHEPAMPQREEEEIYARSGPNDLYFLVALIFASLFGVFAKPVKEWIRVFPFLGKELSFVLLALILYAALVGAMLFGKRYYLLWWEQMPQFLRYQLNRRTGVQAMDRIAIPLCLLIALLFLFKSLMLLPLAIVACVAFVALALHPVDLWPVRERSLFRPPDQAPKPAPIEEGGGYDYKEFRWDFERNVQETIEGHMRLAIRMARYEEFKQKNPFNAWPNIPTHREIIDELASRGITDEVIQAIVTFVRMTEDEKFSTYEELMNVLAFVQESIEYDLSKEQGRDYWRYPVETLEEQRGDCDCKSILAAALFHSLRHKALVLVGEKHLAVAVAGADGLPGVFYTYDGERYYFCETTAEGFRVGELPQGVSLSDFHAYPVRDVT